jgi:hypothetical protein
MKGRGIGSSGDGLQTTMQIWHWKGKGKEGGLLGVSKCCSSEKGLASPARIPAKWSIAESRVGQEWQDTNIRSFLRPQCEHCGKVTAAGDWQLTTLTGYPWMEASRHLQQHLIAASYTTGKTNAEWSHREGREPQQAEGCFQNCSDFPLAFHSQVNLQVLSRRVKNPCLPWAVGWAVEIWVLAPNGAVGIVVSQDTVMLSDPVKWIVHNVFVTTWFRKSTTSSLIWGVALCMP